MKTKVTADEIAKLSPIMRDLLENGRLVRRELPGGSDAVLVEKSFSGCVRGFDPEQRTVTVVASDGTIDRYGDTVDPNGWKLDEYHKNPVVMVDHSYSIRGVVGQAVRTWTEGGKLFQVQKLDDPATNPEAGALISRIASGSVRAISVGFRTLKARRRLDGEGQWTGGFDFLEQELLENSWVAVPANPNAVILGLEEGEGHKSAERISPGVSPELIAYRRRLSQLAIASAMLAQR